MHAEKLLPEGVPSEHSFTHLPSPSSSSSPSNPSPSPPSPRPPPSSHRLLWGVHHPPGALYSFLLLFLIHLTNYADRFIPSAVKAQIQAHYGINDFWSSFSLTAFIIVFMLSCPVFGALSDAGWSRRRLISGAVCAWSLLTAATALAPNYPTFIVIRALMGIGESAYITITPSILSDWYQPQDRNQMLGMWSIAIPVGAALGFGLGGVIGEEFGWQAAFLILGLPGLLLGVAFLWTVDPERSATDSAEQTKDAEAAASLTHLQVLLALLRNPWHVAGIVGQAANTFGAGGMADWFPTYLQRQGMSESAAGLGVGGITVVGGILGNLLGPWLSSRAERAGVRNAYLAVCGLTTFVAAVLALIPISFSIPIPLTLFLLCLAQVSLWCYLGPVWSLFSNVVNPAYRNRGYALAAFAEHLLGDASSPSIIGAVSDAAGLNVAVTLIPIAWIVAALAWLGGSRMIKDWPMETAKGTGECKADGTQAAPELNGESATIT